MSQYLVTTPKNPMYNGKTYGVLFRNGRAFVSEHTIEPVLGWTVDQVVEAMKREFGYEVEPVKNVPVVFDETGDVVIKPTVKKRTPKKAGVRVAPEAKANGDEKAA